MNRLLPALLAGLSVLTPVATQAAAMDEPTKLHLRCGAAYLLVAADPEMNNTAGEAAVLRQMGETLLIHADGLLQELGMSTAEREQVGAHYMAEMDAVFTNDLDLGFEAEQCAALVTAAEAVARDAEIDKYLTCGGGFSYASLIKQDEGDSDAAADLAALGDRLLGQADDLMVAGGMDETTRYETGRQYGIAVATKMNAGEDLAYDWDFCASLDG